MTNCTRCTVKPIVKEHMCDDCYESHNEWLAEVSAPKQEHISHKSHYGVDYSKHDYPE